MNYTAAMLRALMKITPCNALCVASRRVFSPPLVPSRLISSRLLSSRCDDASIIPIISCRVSLDSSLDTCKSPRRPTRYATARPMCHPSRIAYSISDNSIFLNRYMKYLYPYERYKENLSTIDELNAAVESNRREGRRSSYVAFSSNNVNENLQSTMQRNQHGQNSFGLPHSMPLSLAAHMAAAAGGPSSLAANGQHIGMHHRHPPHLPQPNLDSMPQGKVLVLRLFIIFDHRSHSTVKSTVLLPRDRPFAISPL